MTASVSQVLSSRFGSAAASAFELTLLFPGTSPLRLSAANLVEEAVPWAVCFDSLGLGRGDRVALVLPHSVDLYAAFFAALATGRVPSILAPPSPKYSLGEFQNMMSAIWPHLDASAVIVEPRLRDSLPPRSGRMDISPDDLDRSVGNAELVFDTSLDPDATAFIQYSSGTTGLKKGIEISHRALLWQIERYSAAIRLKDDDRIASWLPLYHDMGLICCWLMPLLRGIPVMAMSPHDWIGRPASFLEALAMDRSTRCWLPNFAFSVLERAAIDLPSTSMDLSALRSVVNCSEPIRHDVVQRFVRRFMPFGLRPEAVGSCYAMAETTFAITSTSVGSSNPTFSISPVALREQEAAIPGEFPLASSGRPLPGVAVEIRDAANTAIEDGLLGDIYVRSESLFRGYLNNPEATAKALSGGFLRTGDIGFVNGGELYVIGRADDLIIIGGQNIYPEDVESVASGIDSVIPGRVVAFGVHDERLGTDRLVVVAESEAVTPAESGRIASTIRERVSGELGISVHDATVVSPRWLAKSTSGKIARKANREKYLSAFRLDRGVVAAGSDLRTRIRSAIVEALGQCPEDDAASLILEGRMDSLGLAILLVALESEFQIALPLPQEVGFDTFDSVRNLETIISRLQHGEIAHRGHAMSSPHQVKVDLYGKTERDHSLIFLGSCRSVGMDTQWAARLGFKAFNFAIDGSRIEDIYALYAFLRASARRMPRVIVLGIEMEMFERAAPTSNFLLESPSLRPHLPRLMQSFYNQNRIGITDNIVRHKIRHLREVGHLYEQTFYLEGTGDIRYGSLTELSESMPTQAFAIDSQIKQWHLAFQSSNLDPDRQNLFQEIAKWAADDGVSIVTYYTPVTEEYFREMRKSAHFTEKLRLLAEFLRGLSSKGFSFLETYAPHLFGGAERDFSDALHAGRLNQKALFNHLAPHLPPAPGHAESSL